MIEIQKARECYVSANFEKGLKTQENDELHFAAVRDTFGDVRGE